VVLTQQRIGRFTAFTLAASEAGAFERWLTHNGFAMSDEAKPWLAHYVALQFFFVAFRYDRAGDHSPDMTSQTVRIRFQTPDLRAIVPEAPDLVVQTFRDLKPSRVGFGDVVFAPVTPAKFGPAAIAERRFLLPVVDPSLLAPDAP
jgi:hypothetical protein